MTPPRQFHRTPRSQGCSRFQPIFSVLAMAIIPTAACYAGRQPTEERCKNFRSVAAILFERGRLRCDQQRVTGVHKRRARLRFTREGHEFLGEFVPALPRFVKFVKHRLHRSQNEQ
jgi:hypothetical protein